MHERSHEMNKFMNISVSDLKCLFYMYIRERDREYESLGVNEHLLNCEVKNEKVSGELLKNLWRGKS
jgi:hypothetical protein